MISESLIYKKNSQINKYIKHKNMKADKSLLPNNYVGILL